MLDGQLDSLPYRKKSALNTCLSAHINHTLCLGEIKAILLVSMLFMVTVKTQIYDDRNCRQPLLCISCFLVLSFLFLSFFFSHRNVSIILLSLVRSHLRLLLPFSLFPHFFLRACSSWLSVLSFLYHLIRNCEFLKDKRLCFIHLCSDNI